MVGSLGVGLKFVFYRELILDIFVDGIKYFLIDEVKEVVGKIVRFIEMDGNGVENVIRFF